MRPIYRPDRLRVSPAGRLALLVLAAASPAGLNAQTTGQLSSPTSVVASDAAYSTKIAITWDPVADAKLYRILRGATADQAAALPIGSTNSWVFWDTSVPAGQTFHYWVRAENGTATSPWGGPGAGSRAVGTGSGVGVAPLDPPPEPAGNPVTAAKVALGKTLFWDEQLSSTNTVACGTCHFPEKAGADPRSQPGLARTRHAGSDGIAGTADDVAGSPGVPAMAEDGTYQWDVAHGYQEQVTGRSARPMINAAYLTELFWDGRAGGVFRDPLTEVVVLPSGGALESQALGPLLNAVEMAQPGRTWGDVTAKLAAVWPLALAADVPSGLARWIGGRTYPQLFADAFGTPDITPVRIAFAIASYERTLFTDRSPFDQAAGQIRGLSAAAARGQNTFNTHTCVDCHAGPLFSDGLPHHIGVQPVDDARDAGRFAVTGEAGDRGKFVTPGLRNAALRSAFLHTGALGTLDSVFRFYDRGGDFRSAANELRGINLNAQERSDLAAFLESLTDPRLPARQYPFDRPTLYVETNRVPRIEGVGVPGSGGFVPRAIAVEPPILGNSRFTLAVQGGLGGAGAVLVIATQEPPLNRIPLEAEVTARLTVTLEGAGPGNGRASARWPIPPQQTLAGTRFHGRWYVADPAAPGGVAASETIAFTLFGQHGTAEGAGGARLAALSSRVSVGEAAGRPITGIVVGGVGRKRAIIRGVGPTLRRFGISNPLANPVLEVAQGTSVLGTSAGWRAEDAGAFSAAGAFALDPGSSDAAAVLTLPSGSTSVTLSGADGGGGIALLEAYGAEVAEPTAWLAAMSTRAGVGTGAGVLIGGFSVVGEGRITLLVRAVGPGMLGFGVGDVLGDPQLTVHRATGVLAFNDDWGDAAGAAAVEEAAARVGAFRLAAASRDSALLVTVAAGNYTAIVNGAAGTTGTALLEIFVVP